MLPIASSFRKSESESTLDTVIPDLDWSHTVDSVDDAIETEDFDDGSEFGI